MDNYQVEYENGTTEWFQFDDGDDAGKAGIEAFEKAVKSADSPVKSFKKGNPPKSTVPMQAEAKGAAA